LASEEVILSASLKASRTISFKERLARKSNPQYTPRSPVDQSPNPKIFQEIIDRAVSDLKNEFNPRLSRLEFNQKKDELALGFLQEGVSNLATATHQALSWAKSSNLAIDIQLERLNQANKGKKMSKEKEETLNNTIKLMNECDAKYKLLHNQTYACIEDSRRITIDSAPIPRILKRPAPLEIAHNIDEEIQSTDKNQDQMDVINGDISPPSQQRDQEKL